MQNSAIVFRVDVDACKLFLQRYPKVKEYLFNAVSDNKDTLKGYRMFLKQKDENEDTFGGYGLTINSQSLGTGVFYHYDWHGVSGWAELYQYAYDSFYK